MQPVRLFSTLLILGISYHTSCGNAQTNLQSETPPGGEGRRGALTRVCTSFFSNSELVAVPRGLFSSFFPGI